MAPLLGPPSLRDAAASGSAASRAETIPPQSTPADASPNNPVSLIDDKTDALTVPIRGFTENMSATFLTTGNPCLDFFFKVVPDTPPDSLIGLLEVAWDFDPLMSLKLICNLRGVRGTGKSDKEGFYAAALWLHHVHPKTLAGNVKAIADFGYFKDFFEILYRILEGPTIRETQKEERLSNRRRGRRCKRSMWNNQGIGNQIDYGDMDANEDQQLGDYDEDQQLGDYDEDQVPDAVSPVNEYQGEENNEDGNENNGSTEAGNENNGSTEAGNENNEKTEAGNENNESTEAGNENNESTEAGNENNEKTERKQKKERTVKTPEDIKREIEEARALRKEKELNKAKKAMDMYNGDEDYRGLHDSVSSFFHELLVADLEKLKSEKPNEISLAAKWCPSIDSSYDKATLICESIARKVFPREKHPEYEGLEERHYVYRVRDRLRKDVFVPLHKALELPEVFMSANMWDKLPYNRVPSVAMKKYQKLFTAHDKERFAEYLEKVKSGKAKIAAGALLPHEIIGAVQKEEEREVAELQWKRLVDDMTQKGKLSNCIAVSDVSGSMGGTPMEVSVALGVLVSELSEVPWKGKLITFSEDPQIQEVQGDTLLEKTEFVRNMDWGGSTNFQGVFDRILELAVEGKLKDEQMVKRVFVFSDMEFNEASTNPWETDYQVIQRKYSEHGYNSVPEIVFWNLRDSRSIPVAGNQSGVALVSGFSKNMLNIFLDGGGIVNPVEVMELSVAGEEYKKLVVFD